MAITTHRHPPRCRPAVTMPSTMAAPFRLAISSKMGTAINMCAGLDPDRKRNVGSSPWLPGVLARTIYKARSSVEENLPLHMPTCDATRNAHALVAFDWTLPNKEGDERKTAKRQSNGDSQEQVDSLKLKMRNYVWAGHHTRHAVSQAAPAIEREKQQPRRTITLTRTAAPRGAPRRSQLTSRCSE